MSIKRMANGIGTTVQTQRRVLGTVTGISGMDSFLGAFPSTVDNSLQLSRILLTDGAGAMPRGVIPGAYYCPQSSVLGGFGWDVTFTKGQGQFLGRTLLSTHVGPPNLISQGVGFIDVTGPWRSA